MTTYLAGVPEFRFEIVEWAERGGTVFVEAHNSAVPAAAAPRVGHGLLRHPAR